MPITRRTALKSLAIATVAKWKLIEYWEQPIEYELYDLEHDPVPAVGPCTPRTLS